MIYPMRHKPLFHDVQKEMLAVVKRQAYWPYIGLRLSGFIAKGGAGLAFGMLLCYLVTAIVMQKNMNATAEDTRKLAEVIVPYVLTLMGAGIIAGFIYEHLWQKLQPIVRTAAQGIQG